MSDEKGPWPLLASCDASCAMSYGAGDHWCRPTFQCEVEFRIDRWTPSRRCREEAVERITISTGHPERAVGVFSGAVCQKHRLEAQADSGINVLYEPLEVAAKPEDN